MTMPPEQQIAALLAELPDDERDTFEHYYQRRLAQALQAANECASESAVGGADPEEVEAELVACLIREADGRDNPDGLGAVPTMDTLYELVPPASDPRVPPRGGARRAGSGAGREAMSPARWAALIVVPLLVLGWLGSGLVSGTAEPSPADDAPVRVAGAGDIAVAPTTAATATPLVDASSGGDITVAYPSSLEIGDTIYRVVASESELGGVWAPAPRAGTAAWLNGSYVNASFCLPATATELLQTLQRGDTILMRPANGAVRRYAVIRTRRVGRQQTEVLDQRRAGLTLLPCGVDGNERLIAEAAYRPQAVGEPTGQTGERLEIPGLARVQLDDVRIITTTEHLAPGMVVAALQSTVENLSGSTLSWSDLADQLIIDGTAAEALRRPAKLEAHGTSKATFQYLVPHDGAAATWRLTAATGESLAFQFRLPAARMAASPAAVRATITPADVRLTASPHTSTGQRRLAITAQVTATGQEQVTLTAQEISVWIGERSLPLAADSRPLPLSLQPGEPRELQLTVDIPDVAVVEVQISRQRWRITMP